jgi:hypothetical protein
LIDGLCCIQTKEREAAGGAPDAGVFLEALASSFAVGLIEKEGSGWCARARGKERN